jgi:hypothetical protein
VQPVPVSGHPVHVMPVVHTTPVRSPCMQPQSYASCGNYLYCHPTHTSHRSVLTFWPRILQPTSVGARHTLPIDVSVAENSSPHRSSPPLRQQRINIMCAASLDHARWTQSDVVLLDIGTSAQSLSESFRAQSPQPPAICNMHITPSLLPSLRPGQRVLDAPQT